MGAAIIGKRQMTRSASIPWLILAVAAAAGAPRAAAEESTLPWAEAGLTERQAAAHLLDRFAYGPRPGEVDRVLEQGLESWLEGQLGGELADHGFERRVQGLDAWRMSQDEILERFPPLPLVRREAMAAGVLEQDGSAPREAAQLGRRELMEFSRRRGYRPQQELVGQLMAHKVLRAVHSERQLEAILIDFWFNHFNVSLSDNQARSFLLTYERDAIAPGVLGSFHDMLVETAAHPAMLLYLDNAQSTAQQGRRTAAQAGMERLRGMRSGAGRRGGARMAPASARRRPPGDRPQGLNENYARELLELHTLGVDGGYSQEDVIEVARAFTGWAVVPLGPQGERARRRLAGLREAGDLGFMVRERFLFRADAHDAEAKTVLGHDLAPGRGIADGLEVLEILARHPATAAHLARKLAVRFVADEPPTSLVDRLAETFFKTGGDLRRVMRTLAYSPEFWSPELRGAKIKTPFELAVSAVRAVGGEVSDPGDLVAWIGRMGQPLYAYQAPTGYPDHAAAWVSTGALLQRMNFGLNLATGRLLGVDFDLAAATGGREPESLDEALATYAAVLLPERDLGETLRLLGPMVRDPELGDRLESASGTELEAGVETPPMQRRYGRLRSARAGSTSVAPSPDGDERAGMDGMMDGLREQRRRREAQRRAAAAVPPTPLAHVVGVILGSPEFQRR